MKPKPSSARSNTSPAASTSNPDPAKPEGLPADGSIVAGDAPNAEAIQLQAYFIYLSRGCEEGCGLVHWLEAERGLRGPAARPPEA